MSAGEEQDGLYVGYLPVPARVRRVLMWLGPALVVVVAVMGVVWAGTQRSPGTAKWAVEKEITLRGVLVCTPYPAVFVDGGGAGEDGAEGVLLIESGKHGSMARCTPLDGQRVVVRGLELSRGGMRMLELSEDAGAIGPDAQGAGRGGPRMISRGRVTLRGEIVDGKCYLGTMKPGEGKTHKECATLCVRGGIPALFVSAGESPGVVGYVVSDERGGAMDASILPLVADPVEVSGEVFEWGSLRVLRVAPKNVRRL